MNASSGLSQLGEMVLTLASDKQDIAPEELLGKSVTVVMQLRDAPRYFNGYVTAFAFTGHEGRNFRYTAMVRPWLWFLSRTRDCRVFPDDGKPMSVPDIVRAVFAQHGQLPDYEFKLIDEGSYRKRPYCVQYRESDFNFVARLLEEEGIYWYFEHSNGHHKLMLVNSSAAHKCSAGYETLPYYDTAEMAPPNTEYVFDGSFTRAVKAGQVALASYDFERPSAHDLKVGQVEQREHALSDYEHFDFDGHPYITEADGKHYAQVRLNEQQCRHAMIKGCSNAHGLAEGHLFSLSKHPSDACNSQYLCVSTGIIAQIAAYEAGSGAGALTCSFTAIPAKQQFAPPRRTIKPHVQGPQTAVVVGPPGEEIHTDKYGRVKVQFHWDRYGKKNELSSFWVRVSHPWAGKNFGMVDIPRIGQEVVVDFLEGDPDQPLITGRVYNAEQMHPWDLPANATQSGILTRSSKGGGYGNANAIRFEDKKGAEQLWIHAEKNQDIEVENDETHSVGHDRTKTVDHDEITHVKHDRTETVGHDEIITIHHDRKERVDNDEIISIGNDHTETIGGSLQSTVNKTKSETVLLNSAETVGLAEELTIGGLYQVTVGAAHNTTVGAAHALEVVGASGELIGGSKTLAVGGDHSQTVRGQQNVRITGDRSLDVQGKQDQTIKGAHTFKAKRIAITAEEELVLTVGSA
ncbi:MAG TPA: type VI secretion system tip protein TssI/VgrG, partial [Burkholderiaceae bacterium]|nr:type VI secretion system tip protein TssI/VgrG [Burkholderiaceae bacterium]